MRARLQKSREDVIAPLVQGENSGSGVQHENFVATW